MRKVTKARIEEVMYCGEVESLFFDINYTVPRPKSIASLRYQHKYIRNKYICRQRISNCVKLGHYVYYNTHTGHISFKIILHALSGNRIIFSDSEDVRKAIKSLQNGRQS